MVRMIISKDGKRWRMEGGKGDLEIVWAAGKYQVKGWTFSGSQTPVYYYRGSNRLRGTYPQ